jgi:hypothetical protein
VNVIVLQVFVSLMLVAGSVVLFVFTVRSRTLEHADRLALAPLEEDLPSTQPPLPSQLSKQSSQSSLSEPPTPAGESPARGPGEV